jgi:hypothetical protein
MDLALVEVDVLVARLPADEARAVLQAFVADLEAALAEARALLREGNRALAAGADPLALLDLPSERRAGVGDAAVADAAERLGRRAATRRELARVEELMRPVLARLVEADRRLGGM